MCLKLNSVSKDNFQRVRLIETHNTLFSYDIISLCEASQNDSIELPDPLHNIISDNPTNTRHGEVDIFHNNSRPLKERGDLYIDDSIVVELNFGREKGFFTAVSSSQTSPEFTNFVFNFSVLYERI